MALDNSEILIIITKTNLSKKLTEAPKVLSFLSASHKRKQMSHFSLGRLVSWFEENRITSNANVLQALTDLGASEPMDLLDLDEEDTLVFSPILKKLEFVRFKRGIEELRKGKSTTSSLAQEAQSSPNANNNNNLINASSIVQDSNLASARHTNTNVSTKRALVSSTTKDINERPPLPSSCPEKNCAGVLSAVLGKRKNKNLKNMPGPDFRWIVSCTICSTKWHACHFLCGHISKISPVGSSDIIRHEMGRFNRWQKKIKPPCALNPLSHELKAEYNQERRKYEKQLEPKSFTSDKTIQTVDDSQIIVGDIDPDPSKSVDLVMGMEMKNMFADEDPICTKIKELTNGTAIEEGSNPKRSKGNSGKAQESVSVDNVCCEIENLLLAEFDITPNPCPSGQVTSSDGVVQQTQKPNSSIS